MQRRPFCDRFAPISRKLFTGTKPFDLGTPKIVPRSPHRSGPHLLVLPRPHLPGPGCNCQTISPGRSPGKRENPTMSFYLMLCVAHHQVLAIPLLPLPGLLVAPPAWNSPAGRGIPLRRWGDAMPHRKLVGEHRFQHAPGALSPLRSSTRVLPSLHPGLRRRASGLWGRYTPRPARRSYRARRCMSMPVAAPTACPWASTISRLVLLDLDLFPFNKQHPLPPTRRTSIRNRRRPSRPQRSTQYASTVPSQLYGSRTQLQAPVVQLKMIGSGNHKCSTDQRGERWTAGTSPEAANRIA